MYLSVNHASNARPTKAMVTAGHTITVPPVFPVVGGCVGPIIVVQRERERESILHIFVALRASCSQVLHFDTLGPNVPSIIYMYVCVHYVVVSGWDIVDTECP